MEQTPKWTVAIFASRETTDVLQKTLKAAVVACADVPSTIEVLVNGNEELAQETASLFGELSLTNPTCLIRLWHIAGADKAHAWNQHLYHIVPRNELTFFVDGYVSLKPDALRLLAQGLEENADALAATGVPTAGRTASALRTAMLSTGGVHGNLYCIRHSILERMRDSGFRLPVGLYRNDPLLGAIFNYNMDPARFKWTPGRVFVHPSASWELSVQKPSAFVQLKTFWKRRVRQRQGTLENIALRNHLTLEKRLPHELPNSVLPMISSWVNENRRQALKLFCSSPTTYYAYRKLQRFVALPGLDIPPELISTRRFDPTSDRSAHESRERERAATATA